MWVCELTSAPVLDPLLLLAHVAARTRSAMLGVAVVLAPLHAPLRLANQLASLDLLSQGRLAIGVGFGRNPTIYRRHGLPSDRRLTRYLDGLDLMQDLWANDQVSYNSDLWALEGPTNVVKPFQAPRPPLLIGARKPAAVARAARIGDGWVVSGSAPRDEIAAGTELVRRVLDESGRDRAAFTIARRVYVAVDRDRRRAAGRMADWFAVNYGRPDRAAEVSVIGSAEEIAEHVNGLHDSGVDHVIVNPVYDEFAQFQAIANAMVTG